MERPADREIRAETFVEATPDTVWSVLADLRQLPEISHELVRMVPLKPGGLRRGQWYLGINRRGLVGWPTRNVVADLEPGRLLSWDTRSSGARWIWELSRHDGGTLVVHRRPVPTRLTLLSRLFATAFLRGPAGHTDALEQDMAGSVRRLKGLAERGR